MDFRLAELAAASDIAPTSLPDKCKAAALPMTIRAQHQVRPNYMQLLSLASECESSEACTSPSR